MQHLSFSYIIYYIINVNNFLHFVTHYQFYIILLYKQINYKIYYVFVNKYRFIENQHNYIIYIFVPRAEFFFLVYTLYFNFYIICSINKYKIIINSHWSCVF